MASEPFIIDKSAELDAIKWKYGPRYFACADAAAEAAALWGAGINECGVMQNLAESIAVEQKRCSAVVNLHQTNKGYWLYGCYLTLPLSGFGFAASIWNARSFTCDMAARRHALDHLIERAGLTSDTPSGQSEHTMFLQKLEDAKAKQLCLL